MNYIDLNLTHKEKMFSICQNTAHFEWEDTRFINLLKGELPEIRNSSNNSDVSSLYHKLYKKYTEYNFLNTNTDEFINEIKNIVAEIRAIEPYWSGVNIPYVADTINLHKSCLISGEGGIGKSYFIMCLEDELEKKGIKHLCMYGKFCEDVSDIDFNQIKMLGQNEEFVFAFDAINEVSKESQHYIVSELEKLKSVPGVRIIATYRSYTMDTDIIGLYKSLFSYHYTFPGVSFESVIEWLQKTPVIDINEYADVLYSNNPFLLSKLPFILSGKQDVGKNNVSRFTYIYESYIKKTLRTPIWRKTKEVAKFLFDNNKKDFTAQELSGFIDDEMEYISKMEQQGFLSSYLYDGVEYYTFTVDSLADYLIVRHMWGELKDKNTDECIDIIKKKLESFYGVGNETIILMLFDKFSPDYKTIKKILSETGLMEYFDYRTLVKIHFNPEDIKVFLGEFKCNRTNDLIVEFAGYVNKPFNCVNYLNDYYLGNVERQTREISKRLSGRHFLGDLRGRLKNILYFICKCECTDERAAENFYTALWCSSSCNNEIRDLSKKIMFEIMQRKPAYIDVAISLFEKIEDNYIQNAIIQVLSSCVQNENITTFFESLLTDYNFISAKSLKRLCVYLKRDYDYINQSKINLCCSSFKKISKDFEDILFRVDLFEKELLPFRYWSLESFKSNIEFLSVDKSEIAKFNLKLESDFECVRDGACNGDMGFYRDVEKYYSVSYSEKKIDDKIFLCSLENVFRSIFSKYALPFEFENHIKQDDQEFAYSLLRKCVCISIDIFFGSLMCNYYVNDFGTYNNIQNSIGYEIYDPIKYDERLNINGPISIFQSEVEKMCDILLRSIDETAAKDDKWWKDIDITKKNLLNVLQPIQFDGYEWVLLSADISIHEPPKDYDWKDTYIIYSCSSTNEELKGDGNERYLTIETDYYYGNLLEYKNCREKPWLCKYVPNIAYNSNVFEETRLLLPPAEIIDLLDLELNLQDMCWYNSDGEKIIYCNNNKRSYYSDNIMETIFIRKDVYDQLKKVKPIKFFAFVEKFLEDKGYCNETDYHFEIIDNVIVKEFSNSKSERASYKERIPSKCKNCKYGFYSEIDEVEAQEALNKLLEQFGYK